MLPSSHYQADTVTVMLSTAAVAVLCSGAKILLKLTYIRNTCSGTRLEGLLITLTVAAVGASSSNHRAGDKIPKCAHVVHIAK